MIRGRFITIEGIEGAGKTTVCKALEMALQARGQRCTITREPGGTPLAEQIRTLVLERRGETLNPTAELLLMFAARAVHLDNLVRPALARGDWVICDRFTDATRAYQGAGRGVDLALIESLATAVHGDCQPDMTLLLDLPVDLGLARACARRGSAQTDRFESETTAFFSRVREGYLALAHAAPERFHVIDASRSAAEVCDAALTALADFGQ